MTDVFVSYSSKDRDRVAEIVAGLVNEGFDVFWDQEIPAGHDWDTWIAKHLEAARVVVVLWSQESINSRNVRHEAKVALDCNKVIPVLLQEGLRLPLGFYEVQSIDFSDERLDPANTMTLATAVRGHLSLDVGERASREHLEKRVAELESILGNYVPGGRQAERSVLVRLMADKLPVTIFLVNGVKVMGKINAIDPFTLYLTREGQSQTVYLHTISTIMPGGPLD
ncbi:MAG: TIR domain-containing protein [Hyphomonadaceae bacterium]|nr:TIR domain-containing protein [Hyphomonadaceae bacterium]